MRLHIHPENPEQRKIQQVVECLLDGGLIIYPTDCVYVLGCLPQSKKAIERLSFIKKLDPKKANFSLIFDQLSSTGDYLANYDKNVFRTLKKNLPGAFTFILNASNALPKLIQTKKKTLGIRIPDHQVPLSIVEQLGKPIISTSLISEDDIIEYETDPDEIYERYQNRVDLIIDSGICGSIPSTLIDLTSGEIDIIRQGKGELN